MPPFDIKPCGEGAVVVEFGETVSLESNRAVVALAAALDGMEVPGLYETQPTFRSLLVRYEPLELTLGALATLVRGAVTTMRPATQAARLITLPVCYDPALAPDLASVAADMALSPAQVCEAHAALDYHVYMLGFLPGQPYLGQLPEVFDLPRRRTPRSFVPAGSVGIVSRLSSIFPAATPCGWHVIGRCPTPMWFENAARCWPGDRVRLQPISLQEFERLSGSPPPMEAVA